MWLVLMTMTYCPVVCCHLPSGPLNMKHTAWAGPPMTPSQRVRHAPPAQHHLAPRHCKPKRPPLALQLPHCRWACTPKGAAFLWAARHRQAELLPPVTSHGYSTVRLFVAQLNWVRQTQCTACTTSHQAKEAAHVQPAALPLVGSHACLAQHACTMPCHAPFVAGFPRRVSVGRHHRQHRSHGRPDRHARVPAPGCVCPCCALLAHASAVREVSTSFSCSANTKAAALTSCPLAALAAMRAMEPAASAYRSALLRQAVGLLLHSWGTQAALGVQAPAAVMCAVELPQFRSGGREGRASVLAPFCSA